MGILVSSQFSEQAALPLDDRHLFATTTARDALASARRYPGLLCWVIADSKHYKLANDLTTWSELGSVSSVFGRTGAITAATNDYTWAQIDKTTSSLADITTRSHTALTDKGTLTHSQIDALLVDFQGDFGAGGVTGLVPAPAAGDADANKFLKASGEWMNVPSSPNLYTVKSYTSPIDPVPSYTGNNATFGGGGALGGGLISDNITIWNDQVYVYWAGAGGNQNDYFGWSYLVPPGWTGRVLAFNLKYYTQWGSAFQAVAKCGTDVQSVVLTSASSHNSVTVNIYVPYNAAGETVEFGLQNIVATGSVDIYFDNAELTSDLFRELNLMQTQRIRYHTYAGYGSSANKIPYFTTAYENSGANLVTVANSSTNGFSITANVKCVATMTYYWSDNSAANMVAGISLNSTQLTTDILSINSQDIMSVTKNYYSGAYNGQTATASVVMNPGDILRPHTGGSQDSTMGVVISVIGMNHNVVTNNNSAIESVYYYGYTSKDASYNVKFKTAGTRNNQSKLISVDNTNYTKYTILKKSIFFAKTNGATTSSSTDHKLHHYDALGNLIELSNGIAANIFYGSEVLMGIAEVGDYFIVQNGTNLAIVDNNQTSFTLTAVDFEQQILSALPTVDMASIEESYYTGYTSRDANGFLCLKTQVYNTASNLYSIANSTQTRFTMLKRCIVMLRGQVDANDGGNYLVLQYNSAGTVKRSSSHFIGNGERGNAPLMTVADIGDYFLFYSPTSTAPDDTEHTQFEITALDYYQVIRNVLSENGAEGQRSEVWVSAGNGFGSTDTRIRRWTTINKNVGADITYADSATAGGTFTINTAGIYDITYKDTSSSDAGAQMCITKNDTERTTVPSSMTWANLQSLDHNIMQGVVSRPISCHFCGFLAAGDVIRAHAESGMNSTSNFTSSFRITKVSP